ncbi:MAG: FkbM family methyltransferase [Telluria sp.]
MFSALRIAVGKLLGRGATVAASTTETGSAAGVEGAGTHPLAPDTDAAHTVAMPAYEVAYDAQLLERVRSQWRQGEWETLARLDMGTIEHHPDRARLALAVASAWLQLGDGETARLFARAALGWGCNKALAAEILIAGVHNSLGRAAAVTGSHAQMEQHFRLAVAGAAGGSGDRSSLARRHLELHRLGLDGPRRSQEQQGLDAPAGPDALVYPPFGINSYAQNFEDVMLWRALWNVEQGLYIDVGAWDPVRDSVSKAFSERGWRGIHVEPLPEYAAKLRQDRPGDRVHEALVGVTPGSRAFFHVPETGLSTGSAEFAERHRQAGWRIEERSYPVMTLAELLDEAQASPVHWLKIDVEGMEDEVLAGWGDHPARPWVVVLEATEPNSQKVTWPGWQHHLEARGYRPVYFDGLNRFYVHQAHNYLRRYFETPPNVFDRFTRKKN